MNEQEQRAFLRNLIIVARADGHMRETELKVLHRMAGEIGASQTLLTAALSELGLPKLDFSKLSRFSDRVRNLEDMLEIAMVDGAVPREEKVLLLQTATDLGLSQEQTRLIADEVRDRTTS